MVLRPGKRFVLVTPDPLTLPPGTVPTAVGATLEIHGTTGHTTYDLPAGSWKARTGKRRAHGFRFRNQMCVVALKTTHMAAVCRLDASAMALPEPGPVWAVLTIGERARYCGQCGGTARGDASDVFKRKGCPVPPGCP